MILSDFEKEIINSINSKEIKSILDFPKKFFDYTTRKNTTAHFTSYFYEFKASIDVYYIENANKEFDKLNRFLSLIEKLVNHELINEVTVGAKKLPPIFSDRNGKLKPDEEILSTLYNYRSLVVVPSIDLSHFIQNDYKTKNEIAFEKEEQEKEKIRSEEKAHREKAQKQTRILSYSAIGVSVFTAIATTIFNYATYTNERNVNIMNQKDTVYIKVLDERLDSSLTSVTDADSLTSIK